MMEYPTPNLPPDPYSLDRLRLDPRAIPGLLGKKRLPCHQRGDPFIKGPIPYTWLSIACRLPGAGLQLAMAFRFLCRRYRPENRWGLAHTAGGLWISFNSAQRALHAAEEAGLLVVARE